MFRLRRVSSTSICGARKCAWPPRKPQNWRCFGSTAEFLWWTLLKNVYIPHHDRIFRSEKSADVYFNHSSWYDLWKYRSDKYSVNLSFVMQRSCPFSIDFSFWSSKIGVRFRRCRLQPQFQVLKESNPSDHAPNSCFSKWGASPNLLDRVLDPKPQVHTLIFTWMIGILNY